MEDPFCHAYQYYDPAIGLGYNGRQFHRGPRLSRRGPSTCNYYDSQTSNYRAHGYSRPQPGPSPRYNSRGYYATANEYCRASFAEFNEDDYDYVEYLVDGVIYRRYSQDAYIDTTQLPHKTRPTQAPRKPYSYTQATAANAGKCRNPPGYSLKDWDPSEEPFMLLGSVFDANSLGKLIFDCTVYYYGPTVFITDIASELWLLLIQFSGKVKYAKKFLNRIRTKRNREMVEDFIASAERLANKLRKLLQACEIQMLKAGKKTERDFFQLGKNADTEFVVFLFGRDGESEATEKFMSSLRLWNLRFNANCEDIYHGPGQ